MSMRSVAALVAVVAVTLAWPGVSSAGTVGAAGASSGVKAAPERAASDRGAFAVFDPPEVVARTRHSGAIPAMVIDRNGTVTAVWRQTYVRADGTQEYAMRAARRGLGGHWSTPRTIACPRPGTCAGDPKVGVDAHGTVTAAWANSTGVMVVRRPAGSAWGRPRELAAMSAWSVSLGVADSGAVFVIWVSDAGLPVNGNESYGIWVARRPARGSWTTPRRVDQAGDFPFLAVWPGGSALLAYTQHPYPNPAAVVRTFAPGSGWSAAKVLGREYAEAVAVGPRHSAICVWDRYYDVRARELRHGRWQSPVTLGPPGDWNDPFAIAAAIDRAGDVFVAGMNYGDGGWNFGSVSSKPAGGTWSHREFGGATRNWLAGGPPVVVQTNDANDAIAIFPRRTLFRLHGQTWSPPLAFGGMAGVILPSGAVLRLWWRDNALLAQRVHLG